MKSLKVRFDDILVDPGSRTEESPDGSWSSVRLFLLVTLTTFIHLSYRDPVFRDAGAFVTVILALIGAVVAPKLLDLRVAIGQAAAAIGRKWRKETTTIESERGGAAGDVAIEAENVTVTENGPAAVELVRTDAEQEP